MNIRIYKCLAYTLPLLFLHTACLPENIGEKKEWSEYSHNDITFASPTIMMNTPETRATLMNNITQNTVFGVLGYCVPYQLESDIDNYQGGTSDWLVKKSLSHADVMYKEPIFYDGAKCVYSKDGITFNEPKHWYTSDEAKVTNTDLFQYTFIAYHPYNNSEAAGSGFSMTPADEKTRGIPNLTYTMPYPASTDIRTELNTEDAQDVMIAAVFDHVPTQGAIQLDFRHLLTGLRLQINNYNPTVANNPNANTVTIRSLSIDGNFYRVGNVDFTPADPTLTVTDDKYSGTFPFIKNDGQPLSISPNSAAIVGVSESKPQGTTLLLLPKLDAQADGSTSAVPYLGTNKNIHITYSYHGQAEQTKTISNFSLGRIPEQGTCYTINLNFIGDQLLLMFTADDIEYWENGSDNDIIIN
ncbi:fimbrillin family protein [uncultured Bacteroides sp.]|uniref:fimbrillin family protein n=1 Tax=uncultured Bacteroides sp. TaxID=162156 RepID=UPI0025D61B7F|nr:fimbrillin family protein [uncultured Bacteroides sp.]